jgi:hypothetical protein
VDPACPGRLGRPIWFSRFWKTLSQWSCGSYWVIIAVISTHLISYQLVCHKLKIGQATYLHLLHDDLHFEKFDLCSIPHWLEADEKGLRWQLARELLQMHEQDQQYEFKHILTRDESWFFWNIFIIRAGSQIQMTHLKFSSKTFDPKRASFRLFGAGQESKVCCMFQKAWNIIQPHLSNRLFRIWWSKSVTRIGGKHFEALSSIWTIHDGTTARKVRWLLLQQKPVESLS